jgi:hypothetical protein
MGGGGSPNFSYTFHGDPRATFAQFFGTSNPFENFFNMPGMGGSPHQVTAAQFLDDPFYGAIVNSCF